MPSPSPPSSSTTPPRPSPSKRKRSISDPTIHPFAPHLRDEIADASFYTEAQLQGASSPRSIIADRLSELDLQAPVPAIRFRGGFDKPNGDGVARRLKKVKFSSKGNGSGLMAIEESGSSEDVGGDDSDAEAGEELKPPPKQRRLKSPPPPKTEIPETPQARRDQASSPLESSPSPPSSSNSSITAESGTVEAKQLPSGTVADGTSTTTVSQQKSLKETADHPSQDSLDPDDDGTGLNGIGFRPTPAMAWQRMQKRKNQVQEWRAREAKEARQKRSERRNKATAMMGNVDSDIANTRRTVRFAS